MKLTIITINRNNAEGLRQTMDSVFKQSCLDFEYLVMDGASADSSVETIRAFENRFASGLSAPKAFRWLSEPDDGIYNAMNKGIRMAAGEYIQFLNSGDILASSIATERMLQSLGDEDDILYGNMIKKDYSTGKIINKSGAVECSLLTFYTGTLNHDCCYIRRGLFEKYGLYDEHLQIVSDWKWFLQTIALGDVKPRYVDIDLTVFDAGGISEKQVELREAERRKVMEELIPQAVLADYDAHAFDAEQMDRLRRHHCYGIVYFLERLLFKLEK